MDNKPHTTTKDKDTRDCEHCGVPYTPKVKWQKYCNNNGQCRMAAFRIKQLLSQPQILEEIRKLKEENKKIKERLGIE